MTTIKKAGNTRRMFLLQYLTSIEAEKTSMGRYCTAANYHSTLLSVKTFTGGKDIPMSGVTEKWVNSYASFLYSRGIVRNTVSFYMRILRAAYNRAQRERPFRSCGNPFRSVYTGIDKTVKRSVSLNDIARIKVLSDSFRLRRNTLMQSSRMRELAMDLFLFSFYSRGMCFVDMANLRWSDVRGGRLIYTRRKTGQQMDLKLEPCMLEIMRKYRSSSEYVFPILKSVSSETRHREYRSFLGRYNSELKSIGLSLGSGRVLTSYCSRHSWATASRDAGVPMSVISSGLGHTNEVTTQIYLATLDGNVLDRENGKLLSRLSRMARISL